MRTLRAATTAEGSHRGHRGLGESGPGHRAGI